MCVVAFLLFFFEFIRPQGLRGALVGGDDLLDTTRDDILDAELVSILLRDVRQPQWSSGRSGWNRLCLDIRMIHSFTRAKQGLPDFFLHLTCHLLLCRLTKPIVVHHETMASTTATPTLYVIGSGPGIGRAVAQQFSAERYARVALFARNPESLAADKEAVASSSSTGSSGLKPQVCTYAVDVTDSAALAKVFDQAEHDLGKPECVFYNAARVLPSKLLEHDVNDIEYDFKVAMPRPLPSSHPTTCLTWGNCTRADKEPEQG